jgi:hypothetical protein
MLAQKWEDRHYLFTYAHSAHTLTSGGRRDRVTEETERKERYREKEKKKEHE